MRLIQYRDEAGARRVGAVSEDGNVAAVAGVDSVVALAERAIAAGITLAEAAERAGSDGAVDYDALISAKRLLPPVDHPEPSRLRVTGTGLTHLGSADTRDAMHRKVADAAEETLTDSMKMFRAGLEGGKPEPGTVGVTPEWFYKGDGSSVVAPEGDLPMPDFALDGGEEPEIAGLYLIGPDGRPWRLGFALGNEFSDHVLERQNYLLLAHSKLRPCAFGPELLLGALPNDVRGTSRILRGGELLWEKPFLSGEANMSHTIANLEHHHFKYAAHRRPGDVHVHFFGTATLSFADGIRPEPGDVFEIEAPAFGRPLRNRLAVAAAPQGVVGVL